MNYFKNLISVLVLMLACISTVSFAGEPLKREQIHQIIREYLIENPEIMLEVQQALQDKQQQELAANQRQIIAENRALLFESPFQINFGDPDAEITIVEFFDYNCGFCQRAMEDMLRMLDQDKNVRFVLKEFPVLGQPSVDATRVSMAFSKIKPEKYGEFHVQLLGLDGLKDQERAMQVAESFGVSRDELVQEMESADISQAIQDVYVIADGLGVSGTPSYVVGEEVVFGAVGYDELKLALSRQLD